LTDRHTQTQTGSETEIHGDKHTSRYVDSDTIKHTKGQGRTEKQQHRKIEKQVVRETETQRG